MNEQLNNIIETIRTANFTHAELKQLNGAVVDGMREHERNVATTFRVGQRVQFTGRRGMLVVGEIIKVNLKSIKILADETKVNWKVSPSLLTLV